MKKPASPQQFLSRGSVMITLLIVVVVAMVVTSAGVALIIDNLQSGSRHLQGISALKNTESGLENALLRVLRDPDYRGETLLVNDQPVMITVSGENPKTILVVGGVDGYQRTLEAVISYDAGVWTVTSWREL